MVVQSQGMREASAPIPLDHFGSKFPTKHESEKALGQALDPSCGPIQVVFADAAAHKDGPDGGSCLTELVQRKV